MPVCETGVEPDTGLYDRYRETGLCDRCSYNTGLSDR